MQWPIIPIKNLTSLFPLIFLSKHISLYALGRLNWILDIIWHLNQHFILKNQRNWIKHVLIINFRNDINCTLLHWQKKTTLAKNLSNFVYPPWKLDNPYYHRTWPKYLITAFCMGTHLLIWIFNLFSISSVRNLPNWSWSQPCATPWPVFWVSIMKIHCRSILWLKVKFFFKVGKVLKGSLDLIPSPLPSVKIQIMGGKVYLR